jgi:hypothetical protein
MGHAADDMGTAARFDQRDGALMKLVHALVLGYVNARRSRAPFLRAIYEARLYAYVATCSRHPWLLPVRRDMRKEFDTWLR